MTEKYLSVGAAAKTLGVSAETLRHYDRIGLLSPSHRDEETKYRYYSQTDLVALQTIRALQSMAIPLEHIRTILHLDGLEEVVDALAEAERQADEKIEHLQKAKAVISRARAHYESKLCAHRENKGIFERNFRERSILLSSTLSAPSVEILWDYHRHYRQQLGALADSFIFEDLAGLYEENDQCAMFVLCSKWASNPDLRSLPSGTYLCLNCSRKDWEHAKLALMEEAVNRSGQSPSVIITEIILSGILHWSYEIQVYLGDSYSGR